MSPSRSVLIAACLLLLLTHLPRAALSRSVTSVDHPPNNGNDTNVLNKLLQVFGMEHPGRRERHAAPPQFMLDLYNAIADSKGEVTRTANPYNAKVIRSFPDKDLDNPLHFYFNMTSNIPVKERILEAELHVYKVKPKPKTEESHQDPQSHLLEVRVYQIMFPDTISKEEKNKLLATRRISVHSVGWEVFYVKPAVLEWLRGESPNLGFLVTARTMTGERVRNGVLRFAKRHQHHVNKQPILVLFNDDSTPRENIQLPDLNFHNFGYAELPTVKPGNSANDTLQRKLITRDKIEKVKGNQESNEARAKRSTNEQEVNTEEEVVITQSEGPEESSFSDCSRHEMYVDFEKIGWSGWIVSPKGYNAYYCKGQCSFPLGQNQFPTNHATVQSIVHVLTPKVGDPCCVPNKLLPIRLLYFDDHQNVVLKQYENMVAESCGCH